MKPGMIILFLAALHKPALQQSRDPPTNHALVPGICAVEDLFHRIRPWWSPVSDADAIWRFGPFLPAHFGRWLCNQTKNNPPIIISSGCFWTCT